VGRSSPQPWVRTCSNPLFHRRQPIGACLATCPGRLIDKPDGTTPHTQLTNTCLPAGERPNKKPTFITGVSDAWAFLAWWRASYPCGLTAQLKGEKLMVVPSTADVFKSRGQRTAVPRWEGGCEFSHLHAPGGPLFAASGEEPG
jgi:hypothetical protein